MSEFNFIFNHFAKLGKNKQNFLNDGCEIPVPKNKKLITSKDILISDVHFFRNDDPNSIAQKSLRKNLSDLAAMGAQPFGYLLGISLPKNTDERFVSKFCDGLKIIQNQYKIELLGGDTNTNKNNMLIVSITIFGYADKNSHLMPRNNAKPGDKIYVSGEIGNGYIGYLLHKTSLRAKKEHHTSRNKIQTCDNSCSFNILDSTTSAQCIDLNKNTVTKLQYNFFLNKFLLGNARNDIGERISSKANACIDISDGLLQDLIHICKQSNLSAKIYSNKIPVHDGSKNLIKNNKIKFLDLLKWGDDYELLFCGKENKLKNIDGIFEIGEMIMQNDESSIYLDDEKIKDWRGFEHR
jgi:thiamine-monophosphate kinase